MILLLWKLRYTIQRALGMRCEWRLEPHKHGFIARCRWCGGIKRSAR